MQLVYKALYKLQFSRMERYLTERQQSYFFVDSCSENDRDTSSDSDLDEQKSKLNVIEMISGSEKHLDFLSNGVYRETKRQKSSDASLRDKTISS